jgi:hypothetical protein
LFRDLSCELRFGLAVRPVYFLTLLETLAGRLDSGPYRQVSQPPAAVGSLNLKIN